MATTTQTVTSIDHSEALKVVANDFETEAKKAIAEAALTKALEDPASHDAIIAEIKDLRNTVAAIKRDFATVRADLRAFDDQKFSDGQGGVIRLHDEWANMETVRVLGDLHFRTLVDDVAAQEFLKLINDSQRTATQAEATISGTCSCLVSRLLNSPSSAR
jgi:hypothetical protein